MNNSLATSTGALGSAVADANSAIEALAATTAMEGKGAANIKNYLSQVHQTCICAPLSGILYNLQEGFSQYYAKYVEIEGDNNAVISTDELADIQKTLKAALAKLEQAEQDMQTLMGTVTDISAQTYSGLGWIIPNKVDSLCRYLSDLSDQIGEIETTSLSAVTETQSSIDSISNLIGQYCNNLSDISAYDTRSLISNPAFEQLFASMAVLSAANDSLAAQADKADNLLAGIDKQWEQREKAAKVLKLGLAILETVAFTVAVATTGPVGAAVICGAAGAISGVLDESIDQWASGEAAARGGLDFKAVAYEGVKGGFMGAAKGFIGASFAQIPSQSTFFGKFGLEFGKTASNELVDVSFELIDAAHEGNFHEKLDEVLSTKYITEFVGNCTIESIVDVKLGGKLDDLGEGLMESPSTSTLKKIVWSTAADYTKKTAEDTLQATWEGFLGEGDQIQLSLGNAISGGLEELTDPDANGERLFNSALSNTTVQVYQNTELYEERSWESFSESHSKAVDQKILNDVNLQSANGPLYSHFELTESGPIVFDGSDPRIEILMDHSDPDASYMRSIWRDEGERLRAEYPKADAGRIKAIAKSTGQLSAPAEKEAQLQLERPASFLDSLISLRDYAR